MSKRKTAHKEPCEQNILKEPENQDTIPSKPTFFNAFDYFILAIFALFLFVYLMTYLDFVNWSLSALGRLALMKLLPSFDWRYLKNKQCLVDKLGSEVKDGKILFNCDLCENLKRINVLQRLDEDLLEERYVELDLPVILTKGLEHWPNDSTFIEELVTDQNFASSYPCKLSTNIFKGMGKTADVLQKSRHFDEFFLHFQNCEHAAMRALRRFTYRPGVVPRSYSPVTYNWLMWSKGYNSSSYKEIELVEKLTVYGQVIGSSHVKLVPRNNCENVCMVQELTLYKGEMVIFTSPWDLEYKPNESGENMAVILEIRD